MTSTEAFGSAVEPGDIPFADGEMTARVRRLRDAYLAAESGLCLERARIYTDVHRRNESQPIIMRRALSLRTTLEEMSIWIAPDELLAGCHASRPRAAPIFPEYSTSWILDELDEFEKRPGDAFCPSEADKRELREILPWWRGKTLYEKGLALMTEESREIYRAGLIHPDGILTCGDGHIAIRHEKLLEKGIGGYLREIADRLAGLNPCLAGDVKKRQFYEAAKICLEGMSAHIGRFGRLAAELAARTETPERRAELLRLSETCRRLTNEPAQTFFDAMQMICFSQIVFQIESNGHSLSLGRLDQYLYPYYRRDILSGRLTEEETVELLQCLWVKLVSINKIRGWKHTRCSAGSPLYQNVTIGGQTPEVFLIR
ncbi:MAG: hypothetical protein LBE84_11915 [Planctomycetota bacterium]|jgi:formate C-acetyltransferase|nr:hypothetical protein [Planctomycetota bacterium]